MKSSEVNQSDDLETLKQKIKALEEELHRLKSIGDTITNDRQESAMTLSDMAASRQRENLRLELAIDAVNMAWWDMDIVTGKVVFHPRKTQMLGYSQEKFNHYRDFMDLVHPDDYESAMTAMRNHFSGKAVTYDTEYRIRTSDGSYKWFYDIGTIVSRDETGKPLKIIGFVIDVSRQKIAEQQVKELNANLELKISERTAELAATNEQLLSEISVRKKAEEEAKYAMNEARKAVMAKSEFMSRMSHELRTPLNSILGFAQLLELGNLSDSQRKGVSHIMHSGKQLLNLINEVLDITQIETGRLSLSLEPVQLKNIFNEIEGVFSHTEDNKGISIEFLYSEIDNLFIKADYQRLKQSLKNLIDNAIKYNRENGSVIIKTEKRNNFPGEYAPIRIMVIDTGVGIAKEDIPKLFKPFEKIGKIQREGQGSGLGLTLVKQMVNIMGGTVGVESSPEVGSTFWMEFQQVQSPRDAADISALSLEGAAQTSGKQSNILYVEDNASNIELVEEVLSARFPNTQLHTTSSGRKAVKMAAEITPDLILLDLDLPDIHGSEVLELLKSDVHTAVIPVIVLSADAMPHRLQKLLKAGAKNYLTKPLDINSFLKTVEIYL
jgi:PAS domain S-box-containing protein